MNFVNQRMQSKKDSSPPKELRENSWWPASDQWDFAVSQVNKTIAEKYSNSYKDIAIEEEDENAAKPTKGVILPDSMLRVCWDASLLIIIILQWFIIPFNLAFAISPSGGWYVLEVFMTSMFLLDLVLNFNTGFYAKGNLVTRRA